MGKRAESSKIRGARTNLLFFVSHEVDDRVALGTFSLEVVDDGFVLEAIGGVDGPAWVTDLPLVHLLRLN